MNQNTIEATVTAMLGAGLIAALIWIATHLCRLLDVRTKIERERGAVIRLDHVVTSVVQELQQVTVGALKAGARGGKLGKNVPLMVQRTALSRVKQYLGPKALGALGHALTLDPETVDRLIGTRIEAAVYEMKGKRRNPRARTSRASRMAG